MDSVVDFQQRLALLVLRQENAGPAAARNAGAATARSVHLAFTDDDCRPAPRWLASLAPRYLVTPCQVLGGKVANGANGNRFSTSSPLTLNVVYRHYNADPVSGLGHGGSSRGSCKALDNSTRLRCPEQARKQ